MKGANLLVVIGWLAILLAGVAVNRISPLRPKENEPVWVAARDLPVNTYLADQDLKTPDGLPDARSLPPLDRMVGRYLSAGKQAGEQVRPADIQARPVISDTVTAYVYPLAGTDAALAGVLAPGDRVSVCAEEGLNSALACTGPLTVLATHTGTTPDERWLLLDVSKEEANLIHILRAEQHFVLRVGKK